MRMLLGLASLAAIAVPAAPAAAQDGSRLGFVERDVNSFRDRRSGGFGARDNGFRCDFRGRRDFSDRGRRGDRRGGGGGCDVSVGTWHYGGEWALYNNRTWESDSYNDWWHDRPDRSYPRWISTNQDCQRQWWSGGGWRC